MSQYKLLSSKYLTLLVQLFISTIVVLSIIIGSSNFKIRRTTRQTSEILISNTKGMIHTYTLYSSHVHRQEVHYIKLHFNLSTVLEKLILNTILDFLGTGKLTKSYTNVHRILFYEKKMGLNPCDTSYFT